MKTIRTILYLAVFTTVTGAAAAQDYPDEYLGLPGDNLNLYAVMNLFQESETLEAFEQSLNNEELMINNLDLNGDNLIDYITVSDYVDGNVHNIVLRAALNRNEQQDVAVFVVEQLSNGAVQIQLIGDEALYGPNYIVEPIYAETPNPGYTGTVYRRNVNVVTTTYYDIAAWPLIRFIFHPGYVVWRSSWYWGYYPSYWRPWRAHYWHYYYGYHYHWHNHYYTHYRHWDRYRCRNYHTYYRSKVRVYSPTVVVNINKNRYRNTYSRPDQRHAGEAYYTRTASRRNSTGRNNVYKGRTENRAGTVARQQSVQRTSMQSTRTRSNVSSNARNANAQRSSRNSAIQRTQPASRSTAVKRSQPNRSSVQQGSRSKKSTPAVQRSNNSSNRNAAIKRSQPSKSRSSSVQRSQPSNNRSSSVQRNNSSSSSGKSSAVKRSQSSKSRSSSVQRSQPSKSRSSSVQRSNSRKSTPSVKRNNSSSSKKSSSSKNSSSSRKSNSSKKSSSRSSRR